MPDETITSLQTPSDYEQAARYTLHDPREIVRVLSALCDAKAMISAHVMPGGTPMPTAVVEVDADGSVVIDASRLDSVNRRVLEASHLLCISQLERVRIQFRLQGLTAIEHDGHPAFRAPCPEALLQLQRRELFRLALFPGPHAGLLVPHGNEAPKEHRVLDISGGGLAMAIDEDDQRLFEARSFHEGCELRLPDTEPLPVHLQVAHVSTHEVRGQPQWRVGCRFIGLLPTTERQILQFIFKVERQRNARERRAV
jgi:c-di-GMP-binding flagellar brake protein YcgR